MKNLSCLAFSHPARKSCGEEVISGSVLTSGHGINFPLNDRFIGVFFIRPENLNWDLPEEGAFCKHHKRILVAG